MDPISQGLLGASAAQLSSQHKIPKSAWFIGFLAGMAADLDIIIRFPSNPLSFMIYHRHFTHSIFFIPFGGAIVAAFLCWVHKRYRAIWKDVFIASTAGYATHGFLDVFTSYGTVYFWPFTSNRYSLDWVSIVDPVFTLCLLLGVAWGYRQKSRSIVSTFLLLALSYLGIGGIQHERALMAQDKLAHQRLHPKGGVHRVMPTFGNLFHWRSVYVSKQTIFADMIHVPFFAKPTTYPIMQVPHLQKTDIVSEKNWQKDLATFNWFSDGLVGVMQTSPLVVTDMRYLISIHPPSTLWSLAEPKNKKTPHLRLIRRQTFQNINKT